MSLFIFNSKSLIGRSFLFFIILLVILYLIKIVVLIGVRYSSNDQIGKVNNILGHNIDPDMVIFGSSVAEVGFHSNIISENTSLKIYNAAIDGTRLLQNKILIEEFLNYSQNCKYIVLDLAFFSFTKEVKLTQPSRLYAHINNNTVYNGIYAMQPQLALKMRYIPFYSFTQYDHTFYKNALLGWKNIISNKKIIDNMNGFVPHYTKWLAENNIHDKFGTQTIQMDKEIMELYKQVITQCNRKNIRVILVNVPMQIEGQWLFANYQQFTQEAKKLIDECNTINRYNNLFLNYANHPITLEKDNYYNHGHLNAWGAEKFSLVFAADLIRNEVGNSQY